LYVRALQSDRDRPATAHCQPPNAASCATRPIRARRQIRRHALVTQLLEQAADGQLLHRRPICSPQSLSKGVSIYRPCLRPFRVPEDCSRHSCVRMKGERTTGVSGIGREAVVWTQGGPFGAGKKEVLTHRDGVLATSCLPTQLERTHLNHGVVVTMHHAERPGVLPLASCRR